MRKLIIPKTYVPSVEGPIVFLAGPIRSAPNWQDEAIEFLFSKSSDLTIVSPRRGIRESISGYIAEGDEDYFSRQRLWERHYLNLASKKGAILFWLPYEEKHNCEKSYGAMTRLELGQWMTNYRYDKEVKFCVGTDGNFPEIDTIEVDLGIDAPDKEIKNTLEETCIEALSMIR
jgi:Nucleoside 2-deoxyribosyltransferase like